VTVTDFPDWIDAATVLYGDVPTFAMTDFPDWTHGVTVLPGVISAGQDFPDWTEAVGQVAGTSFNPPTLPFLLAWYDAAQVGTPLSGAG
jgi:hypothetical protein